MEESLPRMYVYARLKNGEPRAGTPVNSKDLEYWLRLEHLPDTANIRLCLSGISPRRALKYRWMVVFTQSPMFDTMGLPADMVNVFRELVMFLYLVSQGEKGFMWALYRDVAVAIVHHAEYQIPTQPVDHTPWLLALLKYIKQKIGFDALKDRLYTPGEIRLAEELMFGLQKLDVGTWVWPHPAELYVPRYNFLVLSGPGKDPRHRSPITVDWSTVRRLHPEVKEQISYNLAVWTVDQDYAVVTAQ